MVYFPQGGYEFTKYDFDYIKGIKDVIIRSFKEENIYREVDFHNNEVKKPQKFPIKIKICGQRMMPRWFCTHVHIN